MKSKRVSVTSTSISPDNCTILVVVWKTEEVDDQDQESPIGEKVLTFPAGTPPEQMLPSIEQAAQEIEDIAEQAKELRQQLNELLQEPSQD